MALMKHGGPRRRRNSPRTQTSPPRGMRRDQECSDAREGERRLRDQRSPARDLMGQRVGDMDQEPRGRGDVAGVRREARTRSRTSRRSSPAGASPPDTADQQPPLRLRPPPLQPRRYHAAEGPIGSFPYRLPTSARGPCLVPLLGGAYGPPAWQTLKRCRSVCSVGRCVKVFRGDDRSDHCYGCRAAGCQCECEACARANKKSPNSHVI